MTVESQPRAIDILLIEDNPGDIRLTQEILKESKIRNQIFVVDNGADAMAFLLRQGKFSDAVRPDLILLDLNLPRKDGREVLAEIKRDPVLKRIPVVILTTSKDEQDVLKTYELYANCYITKPVGLEQFVTVVRAIEDFWLAIVKLPPDRKG